MDKYEPGIYRRVKAEDKNSGDIATIFFETGRIHIATAVTEGAVKAKGLSNFKSYAEENETILTLPIIIRDHSTNMHRRNNIIQLEESIVYRHLILKLQNFFTKVPGQCKSYAIAVYQKFRVMCEELLTKARQYD